MNKHQTELNFCLEKDDIDPSYHIYNLERQFPCLHTCTVSQISQKRYFTKLKSECNWFTSHFERRLMFCGINLLKLIHALNFTWQGLRNNLRCHSCTTPITFYVFFWMPLHFVTKCDHCLNVMG